MNGTVVFYEHHNKRGGAMVEIITATDFAANAEIVNTFGKWVAMMAYGMDLPSWDYFIAQDKDLDASKRLADLKAEIKEEVRVGRITILKVG